MEKKNPLQSNALSFILKNNFVFGEHATRSRLFIMGLCFFIFLGPVIKAEEHGGAPEKEEDAKSEEGEKSEKSGGFIKKDEFLELNSSVEQLGAKIKTKNENIKKLLADKDHIKDSGAFKEIVKQIETEYREIKEIQDNIEKKKIILRHRFPERSFVKSTEKDKEIKADDVVMDLLIEKKVNQLLKLVESQYQSSVLPKKLESAEDPNSRTPASSENSTTPDANHNPEDFSHSLLLKK